MNLNRKHFTVFEHQTLKLNQEIEGVKFGSNHLKALQGFFGEKGVPYYALIHNGVRFNEHVGVIQIGETVIEVLPKADNLSDSPDQKAKWRDILIDMLFTIDAFNIHSPSSSSLKLKPNSILDLYFEMFIQEVEYLLHTGLIKRYRKKEGNVLSLKGNLLFNRHLQRNLVHQERFYTHHSTYDMQHKLHCILYKTICFIKQINTNVGLHSRLGSLSLNFPEMPDIKITESVFQKIAYSRKNHQYQKSIEIARLILLKFHPDIKLGRNNVLAIMFDMNKLWEQFVYTSLRKFIKHPSAITAQTTKSFWKPKDGYHSKIRPDIIVNHYSGNCVVLDTKWKNLNGYNPSPDDLRQMYIYHSYYNADKVALIYPGTNNFITKGKYIDPITGKDSDNECSIVLLGIESDIKTWQKNIYIELNKWLEI
ncbi:McrC family protein [Epilithonimonas mollis]|uniref:5-methylcytosine-specific restriction enzyme subunit McrC n=1 Tax=Epilithonimonas mollis TaxID=216903 RepID=A0A1M6UIT0_9FLAO|nr:restriction endonuclease [Epilithonimonas mollis]SHK69145.1 5-methylcytosine-specific restriction enzyme subunit McrC [Epilithonimonas mollis]